MPPFVLDIRSDAARLSRSLDALFQRKLPYVTMRALNDTAKDVKAAEVDTMKQVFDRPTRFTLNALRVKPATYARIGTYRDYDLVAYVDFKDGFGSIPAWRYLGPEVEGGKRAHKSHELALIRRGLMRPDEFAVPAAGAKLDAYGNLPGPQITRILSQLGAAEHSAGYQANMTARSRKRNIRRAGGRYFVIRDRGVPAGIYFRTGPRQLTPIILFVAAPQYAARFPFYGVAERVTRTNFARHWRRRLGEMSGSYRVAA